VNLQQQSVVVVSGELADGTLIEQEIPLTHDAGATTQQIIAFAFKMIAPTGALLKDGPDGTMLLYSFGAFPKGVKFEVKKVQLASRLLT